MFRTGLSVLLCLLSSVIWAGQWAVVDVRTSGEFETSHVAGAANIPYDSISERIGELGLSRSDEILLYCRSGRRAELAKTALEGLGYTNVKNLGSEEQAETYFSKR